MNEHFVHFFLCSAVSQLCLQRSWRHGLLFKQEDIYVSTLHVTQFKFLFKQEDIDVSTLHVTQFKFLVPNNVTGRLLLVKWFFELGYWQLLGYICVVWEQC